MLLDGALGTELERDGVDTTGPAWSAAAVDVAPERVAALHRAYDLAGAQVHTACTFRTTPRAYGTGWERALRQAVGLARAAVRGRVAGSLGPLEDCWHPERSPQSPESELSSLATALAGAGVDLLLCETFAHVGEARAATRAAVATGLETWASFTAGPDASLLRPGDLREAARLTRAEGAALVLVNCVHAARIGPYVEALAESGVPFGVYANAGLGEDRLSPEAFADHAVAWRAAGARVVGGCCGAGPSHVHAMARRFAAVE